MAQITSQLSHAQTVRLLYTKAVRSCQLTSSLPNKRRPQSPSSPEEKLVYFTRVNLDGEKNKFEIECYKLHLKLPYGDEKDKVVAGFVRDENENNKYICVSDELNIDYDTFIADSVEDAKKQVEGMLLDHWKEQIVYLEDCIDLLQNGKE